MKKKNPFIELLKNESLNKDSYLFQIEQSKMTEELAFLKIEVFNHKKETIFKFKIQIDITDDLKKLPVGVISNKVGLLGLSSKNLFDLMKDGVEKAIREGRIPFIPGK